MVKKNNNVYKERITTSYNNMFYKDCEMTLNDLLIPYIPHILHT